MALGSIALFLVVHIALVWMVTMMKKSRYKLIAFFLIALSIFGYISFNLAFGENEVDLSDFNGVSNAAGVYFSWLGTAFGNAQTVTSRVIEGNSEDKELK